MNRRRLCLLCAGLALALSGCALQSVRPTPARMRVLASPPEARVFVDDAFVASARVLGEQPVELSPGLHQVTLEAPGYFPHDLEVDLESGTTTVRVELRPIPQ